MQPQHTKVITSNERTMCGDIFLLFIGVGSLRYFYVCYEVYFCNLMVRFTYDFVVNVVVLPK